MTPLRRCTILDLPDMLRIAVSCYPEFNQRKAVEWAQGALLSPKIAFFRTDDCWGAVTTAELWYEDQPRAVVAFLAGSNGKAWEACVVLRAMLEWSRRAGAASFSFGEETGMNMEALAKRIGAQRDRPSFRLEIAQPKPETPYLSTFWRKEVPCPS
jgi:hypothetical protein